MLKAAQGEGGGTYPNHRTERIADDEEGEAEEGFNGRDIKICFDTREASRVNCGADVDRGCEEADLESDKELLGGRPILGILGVVYCPVDEEVVGAFFSIGWDESFLAIILMDMPTVDGK